MLNHYPLWKYVMLVIVIFFGLLYALPNLYSEDLAVQITGARGGSASDQTLDQIHNILKQENIQSKSLILENGTILARFANIDVQLRAREAIMNKLGKEYVVALNLAPTTPHWLRMLSAEPMKLGLDLRGGVHFLMEVDIDTMLDKLQKQNSDSPLHHDLHLSEVREYAIEQNINILRNRVNQLGVAEPLVQRQGYDRIVVELPGIQDTARAKEILGATATLEFLLVNTGIDPTSVSNGNVPNDSEVKKTQEGQQVVLYKHVILSGDHITDSTYSIDDYNQPQVNIMLDSKGGKIMSNFTEHNIGKLIATLFVEYRDIGKKDTNGRTVLVKHEKVINIANIQSRFSNSFRITGINNLNEARQLSMLLRAGALIAPIRIVEERIIGPTMGTQNIKQGLEACLWGLIASILFMVVRYKKFGLIATSALLCNLILIIGIMSLLPGATLTMPGIAGILLTLAVAVDANVLINERIKEEIRNGRSVQKAIHEGYKGAFCSIVDANVTTLIKVIILYTVGTGSIKGFAITTLIGIATSMFTAIVGTRAIVNLLYGSKCIQKLSI
ncbi:protein translocase subunit SecD [Pantoea sp. Nvir]|uniref:protein translocase subunit SecD n=1 Tax=Pantoea sp. Nvir TaxID=2576760 RepID=UPI0027FD0F31|nr:protein translocase subunit SecD [Pantoea sp. Nvir]CAJ0993165.1 Protein translocase subunit SecD [Pantoea sp. Nvir]